MRKTYYILLTLLAALSLTGLGCKGGDATAQKNLAEPIVLQWWRTDDNTNSFSTVVNDYRAQHPNVSVNVKIFRPEELEQQLLEALASGKGPDLVSLPNTRIKAWQERLAPLPTKLNLSFIEMKGFIKKEPTAVQKQVDTIKLTTFKNQYVDVVTNDAVIEDKIYALPLSLDTLHLYYNRTLLNAANIPLPPSTWNAFKADVQKLTKLDKQSRILQSGVALGEADNITYAPELVAALMLQNGTSMVNSNNTLATFAGSLGSGNQKFVPGQDAIRFYTDYANPSKETYSWSKDEVVDFQAFASGKVGFMFALWKDQAKLKTLAPQLKFGIANFPQIDGASAPTYYAAYNLEAVTKQSTHQNEAWDFLQFLSQPKEIAKYLSVTRKPTAHLSLIPTQSADPDMAVAAKQLLNAKNWYHGRKPLIMEEAFRALIRQINGGTDIEQALQFAAQRVNQTF